MDAGQKRREKLVANVLHRVAQKAANFDEVEDVVSGSATTSTMFVIRKDGHVYYVSINEFY